MIKYIEEQKIFLLETKDLTYAFYIHSSGLLGHLYFGKKIQEENLEVLFPKLTTGMGTGVVYEDTFIENIQLEYSFIGLGDYKDIPMQIKYSDGSYIARYKYLKHFFSSESETNLPHGRTNQILIVVLYDNLQNVQLEFVYKCYEETNVIGRYIKVINLGETITINKIMSFQLDLLDAEYDLISFDGCWANEANPTFRPITLGTYSQNSTTGFSSNKVNPGFILTTKSNVECYGFNLIYSGNHFSSVQRSYQGIIRIHSGIAPFCFEEVLKKDESFVTPEVIMTYSNTGLNQLSQNFHDFINNDLINETFKKKTRPVVINSWESFSFDFNEHKLIQLAKSAKKVGVELFVLDDGWFGNRNDDTSSLGDYTINKKKFKHGLKHCINEINKIGLDFGIWVEPEMINEKSELYLKHPEYVLKSELFPSLKSRNQWVLDLANIEVQDYIIDKLVNLLSSYNIKFLKWDMNRHISDFPGSNLHNYILGLYRVLETITKKFPDLLIEGCASGGNRFDLGILYYCPQIWASDNTDPTARMVIQEGLSYLYPLSTISCHVSLPPHFSTLRNSSLSSRFHVACFGILGYELDLRKLSKKELKIIKQQIAFYKEHRQTIQFANFYRHYKENDYRTVLQIGDSDCILQLRFQFSVPTSPYYEKFKILGIKEAYSYHVTNFPIQHQLKRFGHLLTFAVSKKSSWLITNKFFFGILNKFMTISEPKENYIVNSDMLLSGYPLRQQFMGNGYSDTTRILRDNDSEIYILERI